MHDDFKDRNPGPYSGLVSFISGSGHVHTLWTLVVSSDKNNTKEAQNTPPKII